MRKKKDKNGESAPYFFYYVYVVKLSTTSVGQPGFFHKSKFPVKKLTDRKAVGIRSL